MSRRTTDRKRWIALDVAVVNVELPSIRDALGFSRSSLARVLSAYLIAFGSLLAGRLGDLISRRGMKTPLTYENAVIYGAGERPEQRHP